jgi:hypothetical protein
MSDAGDDAAAEDAGDAEIDGGDTCEEAAGFCSSYASGVFAIKSVIDVYWQDDVDPPLIAAARSHITVFQKATVSDACADGELQNVEVAVCGLTLPPYVSYANCNAYRLGVADAVWDEPTMPAWNTTGSINSFAAGGVIELNGINALLGIDLTTPLGTWPSGVDSVACAAGGPDDCFPDDDDDGDPGIPLSMLGIGTNYRATGCGVSGSDPVKFQGLPINALSSALCDPSTDATCDRAVKLYAGARIRQAPSAAFEACGTNMARLSGNSSATSLDFRAVDCELNDGPSCSIPETQFADSLLPNYTVLANGAVPPTSVQADPCECSGGCTGSACSLDQTPSLGPQTAMVWLGPASASFDCEDVREAAEAAYPGTSF